VLHEAPPSRTGNVWELPTPVDILTDEAHIVRDQQTGAS
jgi:hypothetical protein